MSNGFFPGIDLVGRIQHSKMDPGISTMPSMRMDAISETPTTNFKGVMSNLASGLNQEINAPDQLLKDAVSGNNNADIHDVMTAMAKAELSVNVATQITGKVIQAYDKIMAIQV
jgi:flagellar hook-basal body complex protein FliE